MLGAGAFAVVYLAWDGQLQREVAVKIPHSFLLRDAEIRQRFLDEARLVASLRHPRIVTLYDAERLQDGTVYLVFQHIAGQSLRDLLRKTQLKPQEACAVTAKVADAIAAAHCKGVFHRDLKPDNILLDENNEPHVCDFGLAVQASHQCERRGERAGTLCYMAPEQLRGESHMLDGRADIWAVGVILYEMLTGRAPFLGRDRAEMCDEILHRDPCPPRQLNPLVSSHQQRVCLRCLAKRPVERYSAASDVARQLRRTEQAGPLQSARRMMAAAIVILLVTLISGAAWLYSHIPRPAVPAMLSGDLNLLVWDAQNRQQPGLHLVSSQSTPLHEGDRVRLTVRLNQPAFIYLVWFDAAGEILPVYPWAKGDWSERPESERKQLELALPENLDRGWVMRTQHGGTETVLLLARRTPLPLDFDLQHVLSEIPYRDLPTSSSTAWFHAGQPWAIDQGDATSRDRSPVLSHAVTIADPLLQIHRRIAQLLSPQFEVVHGVSFSVAGCADSAKTPSRSP